MIPLVDLEARRAVDDLVDALSTFGFVQLAGHGIDHRVIDEQRRAAERFFALPADRKACYEHPEPMANRGYRARGSEALAYSLGDETPADIFESFNAGRDPRDAGSPLWQPTPWPDLDVPGFRAATLAAFDAFAFDAFALDARLRMNVRRRRRFARGALIAAAAALIQAPLDLARDVQFRAKRASSPRREVDAEAKHEGRRDGRVPQRA